LTFDPDNRNYTPPLDIMCQGSWSLILLGLVFGVSGFQVAKPGEESLAQLTVSANGNVEDGPTHSVTLDDDVEAKADVGDILEAKLAMAATQKDDEMIETEDGSHETNGTSNLCLKGTIAPELLIIGGAKAAHKLFSEEISEHQSVFAESPLRHQPTLRASSIHISLMTRGLEYMWLGVYPPCQQEDRVLAVDTTSYLTSQHAPHTLKKWYGDHAKKVELLVFLADPVLHLRQLLHESKPDRNEALFSAEFGEYVDALNAGMNTTIALHASYRNLLNHWFSEFPSTQFTIVPAKMELSKENRGLLAQHVEARFHLPKRTTSLPDLDFPVKEVQLAHAGLSRESYHKLQKILGTPNELGAQLKDSNATLFGFRGNRADSAEITHWLTENW